MGKQLTSEELSEWIRSRSDEQLQSLLRIILLEQQLRKLNEWVNNGAV